MWKGVCLAVSNSLPFKTGDLMSEREKYCALLEAVYDEDVAAFKHNFIDLLLFIIEEKIQRRAGELGIFFQPGVTFENEDGSKSALYDLCNEDFAQRLRELHDEKN
jgi:hypothetical protein